MDYAHESPHKYRNTQKHMCVSEGGCFLLQLNIFILSSVFQDKFSG